MERSWGHAYSMLVLPPSPSLVIQHPALAVLKAYKTLTQSLTQNHT
jgi:hypothetical protein